MARVYITNYYRCFCGIALYPYRTTVHAHFLSALKSLDKVNDSFLDRGLKEVMYENFSGDVSNITATVIYSYTISWLINEHICLSTQTIVQ